MISKVMAKAVIFNADGQVLLLRRRLTDDHRPGEQDFPGGTVEPGEDLTAGVSREIREETGLRIIPEKLQLMYAATQTYPEASITRLLFWATVTDQNVRLSSEHDDFHWAYPETVLKEFPHPFYGAGLKYGLDNKLFS